MTSINIHVFQILSLILVGRVFANGPRGQGSVPGQVIPKSKKIWYLMPPCIIFSIIRYGSRVKWSNPGKGVVPFTTPWCCSYWKGSLHVTLDNSHQLYLYRIKWWGIKSFKSLYLKILYFENCHLEKNFFVYYFLNNFLFSITSSYFLLSVCIYQPPQQVQDVIQDEILYYLYFLVNHLLFS